MQLRFFFCNIAYAVATAFVLSLHLLCACLYNKCSCICLYNKRSAQVVAFILQSVQIHSNCVCRCNCVYFAIAYAVATAFILQLHLLCEVGLAGRVNHPRCSCTGHCVYFEIAEQFTCIAADAAALILQLPTQLQLRLFCHFIYFVLSVNKCNCICLYNKRSAHAIAQKRSCRCNCKLNTVADAIAK